MRRGRVAVHLISAAAMACDRASTHSTLASASAPATASASQAPPRGVPCGALSCRQYDSVRDAFAEALAEEPLVLGIGEAHAPRGSQVASAAKRFTDELLPLLAGRASDLLLELMMSPKGCFDAAAEARSAQAPIVAAQADTNQGEYVAMGEKARALGIVPDLLRPTCADLQAIRAAGDDTVEVSLETIARLARTQAEPLIEANAGKSGSRAEGSPGKLVVLYGGAMHNDLTPAPGRGRYTYAPDLDVASHGRFVALDLIVPEFIGDSDLWRSLPWWPSYDQVRRGGRAEEHASAGWSRSKATLFRTAERSFVLVFPETRR